LDRRSGIHPFRSHEASPTPLVMDTRGSRIRLTRLLAPAPHKELRVSLPEEDTFYAIFQLRDHPPHEFWGDGHPEPARLSPRGCLHIVDLNARPSSVIREPLDSFNMELPRAALDDLADDVGAPYIAGLHVPEPWQTPDLHLRQLQPLIVSALDHSDAVGPLLGGQLLLAMAVHLAEAYGGLRRVLIRTGGLAPWQERRARELIADTVTSEVALGQVAAECGLSMSHFCKAFKVSTGLTPHGWLQQCRLERARGLLRQPGRSLAEIALLCGFADQSHFSRTFHRHVGLAPGLWRRQQAR
jgi:AraC family transcriptional regulator